MAPKARSDLRHAASWYAERHPAGADRFFEDFITACNVLEVFPEAGRRREELPGSRSYAVHPYTVFYVVDFAAKRVAIIRVLPARSDIAATTFMDYSDC